MLEPHVCLIWMIVFLVPFIARRIYQWSRLRHIAGPPVTGWTKLWLLKQAWSGRLCDSLYDACKEYGPLVRIGPKWVLCGDSAEIRRIWGINSGYYRSDWYKAVRLNSEVDNVLTVIDNKKHHQLRSHLRPGYGGKGIANEEQLVEQQIENLIALIERQYVSTQVALRPCNLARTMQYLTQDVITAVGFGKSAGYLEADRDMYGILETSEALHRPVHMVTLLPTVRKILESRLLKPFHPKPHDGRGVGRFLGYIRDLVDERYADLKTSHTDMLQSFINSGLSRPEVESEALVTLFGGTDTTSTALRNIIFYLSTTPQAYRALQSEIDDAFKTVTRPVISKAEAEALPFLQACIKEGLRIFPPSMGLMGKVCPHDDTICGIKVPANTKVAWSALAIMRNRSIFGENADVYDPQRWIDAPVERRKEMDASYGLVFATGTRWECLGKRLAYIELGKTIFEVGAISHVPPLVLIADNLTAIPTVRFCYGRSHCTFSVG
ncbi:benzoate 4-monooxygenase cytochrome P450 [Penicillium vulpinum]|uniref:benzoate 4-monooxygenase cytochrome P450 n=1 Tax=Penicillium vulpinum TaxID=29845 RepID=UPI002548A7E7|nr:benzoate 4-monooxygenase cytochrome P450 [Penicillium vulpinum]KAJ5964791.1 benzoate 4-monooxygenase cytochrome P450 [Penicillium vulpinum]